MKRELKRVKGITRVASGGARGTIDDFEWISKNRRKRKSVVDTTRLDLTVNRGYTSLDRSRFNGGDIAVSDQRRRHLFYFLFNLVVIPNSTLSVATCDSSVNL